jgi:ATPase subunit of ABC transporter with duplicated ATPase domains
MFVETIGAVSTGVSAIELSQKMFPSVKKIFKLLKDGELKIAIFGAGGTGKSTLGKVLSGEFDLNSLLQPYQESISTEQYKLEGSANFTHEYQSASLVIENLLSGANELLVSTTGGYDQRLQAENFKELIKTIETHSNISLNIDKG